MNSQLNLWKATVGVILYVAVCITVVCFAPLSEAAAASGDLGFCAKVVRIMTAGQF